MNLFPESSSICTVCFARAIDSDQYEAAIALLMRRELDRRGFQRHKKLTDAQLIADTSRYFTEPRKEAAAVLQALGKLARPAPTDPPF